jgi:hypothetical protein
LLMDDKVKIRKKIIKRLEEMPKSRLGKVFEYIESLENKAKHKKDILSFAGSWKNIDPALFEELTSGVQERRTRTSRRRVL